MPKGSSTGMENSCSGFFWPLGTSFHSTIASPLDRADDPKIELASGRDHETSSQSVVPHSPLVSLLWKRENPESRASTPDRYSAYQRCSTSTRIPRAPFERRNAEAPQPENRCSERNVRPLQRKVHRLLRRRPRPYQPSRYGRSVEGRSSRQHPGCSLVVQRRKGFEQSVTTTWSSD